MAIPIDIATEDQLSETVLVRLLADLARGFAIGSRLGHRGNGYLKKLLPGLNDAAKGRPSLIMTDLDAHPCPATLFATWIGDAAPQHPNLIFRVAVRSVESWLIADRENLSLFLGVAPKLLDPNPESLPNPKAHLLEAARKSKRKEIRDEVPPRRDSSASQGPGYNRILSEFCREHWNPVGAAPFAPSLAVRLRACAALRRSGLKTSGSGPAGADWADPRGYARRWRIPG